MMSTDRLRVRDDGAFSYLLNTLINNKLIAEQVYLSCFTRRYFDGSPVAQGIGVCGGQNRRKDRRELDDLLCSSISVKTE